MEKLRKFGALFDLDGVVIDSEGAYTEFWAEIGRKYGAASPTFALDIKGTTLTDILSKYFPDRLMAEEIKKELYAFENEAPFPIFDDALRFLKELRDYSIPMAMVTSSDNAKMQSLSHRHPSLQPMFDAIVNGSMVTRSKPHPEGYLKAARMLGVEISNCAVFEDSIQGLQAGRNSGAGLVVGLATTNPAEKMHSYAHVVIPDFKEFTVPALLRLLD